MKLEFWLLLTTTLYFVWVTPVTAKERSKGGILSNTKSAAKISKSTKDTFPKKPGPVMNQATGNLGRRAPDTKIKPQLPAESAEGKPEYLGKPVPEGEILDDLPSLDEVPKPGP